MKRLALLLALATAPVALADYDSALTAWEQRDYAEAFQEFQRLARDGDPYAMYMLGRLYARGTGTVQDYVQAHKWFNLAASRDHRHAPAAREELAGRMTAGQIAEAQQLARNWQPGQEGTGQPAPPAQERLNRSEVAQVQGALNTLGYDAGPEDGLLGSGTRAAIRAYQRDRNLAVTGEATPALLEQLRQDRQAQQDRYGQQPQPAPQPAWQTVIADDFADGNFTRNPAWQVVAGEFRVERGELRSQVLPRQTRQTQPREMRPEDLPLAILGTILEQAGGNRGQNQTGQPAQESGYAEIRLPRSLSGAFDLELQLTVRQGGRLVVGPYRQGNPGQGYRLVYTQGAARSLELVRLEGQGGRVVGAYSQPLNLADGRQHTLGLSRDGGGTLAVTLDGQRLISIDTGAPDQGFAGLSLVNQGGDYSFDRVVVQTPGG